MFDPYYKWLGIAPKDQPPNHYRLLSLDLYENDLDVIEGAADRVMGFVRQYQSGEHAPAAAKMLNEIATARLCLLKPAAKAEYDAKLKSELAAKQPAPAVTKDEPPAFVDDTELDDLMKTSKRIPVLPKSKKKKKGSQQFPPQMLMAGGGAIVVLIVAAIFFGGQSRQLAVKPELAVAPLSTTPAGSSNDKSTNSSALKPQAPSIASNETAQKPAPMSNPANPSAGTGTITTDRKEIATPVDANGPAIDLIAQADLSRDVFEGSWIKDGSSLVGKPQAKLYMPATLPGDYAVKMIVKRTGTGNEALVVGFMMSGHQGFYAFDSSRATASGMRIDGLGANNNCSSHIGPLFKDNQASEISVIVHPGHLTVKSDGQVISDWYGSPDRIVSQDARILPYRDSLYVAVFDHYRIEAAKLFPLEPETVTRRTPVLESQVDLTKLIEVPRDAKRGTWQMNGGVLTSSGELAQLQIPFDAPEEYTLSATVERPGDAQGDCHLSFGLVAGTSICEVIAFCKTKSVAIGSGLEKIDGRNRNDSSTNQTHGDLSPGQTAKVDLTVTKQGVRYERDGRTLVDWRGNPKRLSLKDDLYLADSRKLFVASRSSLFRIRDLKIGPPLPPSRTPNHPPIEPGHPLDLRRIVDLKHDVIGGTWKLESNNKHLLTAGDTLLCKLMIPCKLPEEYKLVVRVGRGSEPVARDLLGLILPVDGRSIQLFFDEVRVDKPGRQFSGVNMDGFGTDSPQSSLGFEVKVVPIKTTEDITIFVRKFGLKVVVGKKTLFDWNGNQRRFFPNPAWITPPGGIGIVSNHSQFRIDKLEVEWLEPSPSPTIKQLGEDGNLLTIIEPARDSQRGEWKLDNNGLENSQSPRSQICVPVPIPERYELSANVERKSGTEGLALGIVIGGRSTVAIVGGRDGTMSGIQKLDGLPLSDDANLSRRISDIPSLPIGQSVHVQCFVLKDSILVKCNDREVIKWRGDIRRLAPDRFIPPPPYLDEDAPHLWVGTGAASFLFRELKLKPLSDEDALKIESSF